jgi:hypothetical protein
MAFHFEISSPPVMGAAPGFSGWARHRAHKKQRRKRKIEGFATTHGGALLAPHPEWTLADWAIGIPSQKQLQSVNARGEWGKKDSTRNSTNKSDLYEFAYL